jgi:hypothetical protein
MNSQEIEIIVRNGDHEMVERFTLSGGTSIGDNSLSNALLAASAIIKNDIGWRFFVKPARLQDMWSSMAVGEKNEDRPNFGTFCLRGSTFVKPGQSPVEGGCWECAVEPVGGGDIRRIYAAQSDVDRIAKADAFSTNDLHNSSSWLPLYADKQGQLTSA